MASDIVSLKLNNSSTDLNINKYSVTNSVVKLSIKDLPNNYENIDYTTVDSVSDLELKDTNLDFSIEDAREEYERLQKQKAEQAAKEKAEKEVAERQKKLDKLEKLYEERDENNGLFHPFKEQEIEDEIRKLEKELNVEHKPDGWESFCDTASDVGATAATFVASTVEGVVDVGETIVDGAVQVVGGAASYVIGAIDEDAGNAMKQGIQNFVSYDASGAMYDKFVSATGIDEDIAYGWAHTAGNITGQVVGYAAISMIPGGAVVTATAGGLAAAGAASENAYANGATFDEAMITSTTAGVLGAVSGGAMNKLGGLAKGSTSLKAVAGYTTSGAALGTAEPLINSAVEYATYGNNDGQSYFEYMDESGGWTKVVMGAGAGGLSTGINAAKGYSTSLNSDNLSSVEQNVNTSTTKKPLANSNIDMYNYYEGTGNSYGVDQGAIKKLCVYEYNGKKMSYNEALDLVNYAKQNGQSIPNISKQGNEEYFYLKNKLISKGFSSEDASVIMSSVDDAGACTYASACNEIFYKFRESPEVFEQVFGYPMYKNIDGVKTLNSAELLLDLYTYANDYSNGGFLIYNNKLNSSCLSNKIDSLGRSMPDVENYQVYISDVGVKGRNVTVLDNFLKSKNQNLEFTSNVFMDNTVKNVYTEEAFNNIMSYLDDEISNGKSVSMTYYYNPQKNDPIINMLSYDTNRYSNMSTSVWNEGGAHSVAVTGITSNGLVVSSWGKKYMIPFEDLRNGGNFIIATSDIGIVQ